jgi:hypothetical protein
MEKQELFKLLKHMVSELCGVNLEFEYDLAKSDKGIECFVLKDGNLRLAELTFEYGDFSSSEILKSSKNPAVPTVQTKSGKDEKPLLFVAPTTWQMCFEQNYDPRIRKPIAKNGLENEAIIREMLLRLPREGKKPTDLCKQSEYLKFHLRVRRSMQVSKIYREVQDGTRIRSNKKGRPKSNLVESPYETAAEQADSGLNPQFT